MKSIVKINPKVDPDKRTNVMAIPNCNFGSLIPQILDKIKKKIKVRTPIEGSPDKN